MYFIFLKTISFFVFFIMVACTNQQDKVLVEGGDPLVTSSSEEKSDKIENESIMNGGSLGGGLAAFDGCDSSLAVY